MVPLSPQRELVLLLCQVGDAKAAGATIVTGGTQVDHSGFSREPTLITNIRWSRPLVIRASSVDRLRV